MCYVEETNGIIVKPYIKPILFTFLYDDYGYIKTFQSENDMTWDEWANSNYNIDEDISSFSGYIRCGGESFVCNEKGNISTRVLGSEQIIPNKTYYSVSIAPV